MSVSQIPGPASELSDAGLPESGEAYRLMFETTPHGIVFQDGRGAILVANPAAQRILGLTLDQLKGRTSIDPRWQSIHEDGSAFPGETHPAMEALRTGQTVEGVLMGVRNPKHEFITWITVSAIPLFHAGEARPYQVLATFVEVTERKQIDDNLREVQARLQQAERVAHFGHWEVDLTERKLHASEGASLIYGVQGKEWTLAEIQGIALPEYRPMLDTALSNLIERGQPYDVEFRIRRPIDGEVRSLHSTGAYDPARNTMFGVVSDISERKHSELALAQQAAFVRSVFDADDSHLAVVGAAGEILEVNAAWRRFALANGGDDEATWGVGSNYFKALADAGDQTSAAAAYDGIRKVQAGLLPTFEIVYPCHSPSEERWFTLRVLPVANRPGTVLISHRDETGRLHAEAELRASETRYHSLFESIQEGFALHEIVTDEQGCPVDYRFLEVNPAFEAVTGLHRERCLGHSVKELLPGLEPRWIQEYGKVALEGTTLELEDFTEAIGRWYHVVAFSPAPRQFATLVTDITSRKQGEDTLRQSEARYRMLSENVADVIWLLNLETGRFEYVSPSVERLRGFTPEEVLTQPLDLALSPESASRVQELLAQRLPRFRADEPESWSFTDEIEQVRKDGSLVATEVTTRYLADPTGQVTKILGVSRDITERRKAESALRASEERFQKAFRSSPILMTLRGLETDRYLEVNDWFCAVSGFTREEVLGKTPLELGWISPQDRDALRAGLQARGRITNVEVTFRSRGGDPVICVYSGEILELDGTKCILSVATDVTDLKRVEEQRKALEMQLQHLHRLDSVGRLAGGVAHDMNNVLSAILGMAELQQMEAAEGTPLYARMATISKACLRGRTVLRGLLDFAREGLANEQVLDLNLLVREEVALLERTTLQKFRLVMDLEERLRPVKGDPVALSHVMMNLCLNAVDAMAEGGMLTLRTRNEPPSQVLLEITDTGSGMPQEILDKAVDPFFTTKAQGKGTGLGLSIVHGTVKAHGGTLALRSTPGAGTTVTILLPVSEATPVEPVALESSQTATHVLRVLIVDDDELIQQSTGQLLEALGHAPTIVDSGEAALSLLEAGAPFDLVILDMNMPGLGGAKTLPRLRGLRPTLPVLLATGRVDQQATGLAESIPWVKLMPKPFTMKDLKANLAELG